MKDGSTTTAPRRSFLREIGPGLEDRVRFLGAFLRRPTAVGALGPSSRFLADAMVGCFDDLSKSETVVELGPGTGAFTGPILRAIGNTTTFLALELDPSFAKGLRIRFPGLTVYNDSAERIAEYLALHGKKSADFIISGLPWASLPLVVQDRIFDAILASLLPGGVFATFGYLHASWLPNAQRFRKKLKRFFSKVETSAVVWRNFPPAFIYRCVR